MLTCLTMVHVILILCCLNEQDSSMTTEFNLS